MKIWTAVLIGFFLGMLSMTLFHPIPRVHANGLLHLHVYEVPKGGDLLPGMTQGSQVVGFSCISAPGQSRCFVATEE